MPTELPTQKQVQADYEAAKALGLSPCVWIPPEWSLIKAAGGTLPDNSKDQTGFENPEASLEADERIKEGRGRKKPENPENAHKDDTWANAFSDFTHVDDSEYPSTDIATVSNTIEGPMFTDVGNVDLALKATLEVALRGPADNLVKEARQALKKNPALRNRVMKALKKVDSDIPGLKTALEADLTGNPALVNKILAAAQSAPPDLPALVTRVNTALNANPPLRDRVLTALAGEDPVGRLKRIVGPGSPGMKRLGMIFEWALYRTTELMGDINTALNKGGGGEAEYNRARQNYIAFLRDLDDHEPEKKVKALDVMRKDMPSGYGRSLKWVCIDPVICRGRIVGARVIIHWNPHSSSNGIPIQHP